MEQANRTANTFLQSARLYVLLTQAHCRIPLLEAARQVLRGGADILQLREKEASDREIVRLSRDLRRMSANFGAAFIVNDRPDVARLVEADGVHLGQEDLPVLAARKVLLPHQILGVSTHSVEQARQASADGADYIGVGPIYPTATRGYETGLGVEYIKAAAETVQVPMVAIGGITLERVPEVVAVARERHLIIAVCRAIIGASDIEATTAAFKETIERSLASRSVGV